jgi:AraC-like DNA-binding protein
MARIVDRYLLARLKCEETHPVHEMVERVVESQGCAHLWQMAESIGLSARQTERKFLEQVGITAKCYARLTRFRNAVRLKAQDQSLSWTDVSHAAGFYDQNHLIKDFRALVGATPSDYLRSVVTAPATELWCGADGLDAPSSVKQVAPLCARQSEAARRKSTISHLYRA